MAGNSREKKLHDDDVTEGRIWTMVLATLMVSPLVVKRLRIEEWSRRQRLSA